MNLNQLIYFHTLAKYEHYTKAAEELEISQPALSNAISSMEKELGTFLFEKQGRNVVLTKHGRAYLKHVNTALDALEKGRCELERWGSVERGLVSLAFIATVGAYLIPKIISNFLKEPHNTNISFSCSEGNTKELIAALKEERYDMLICSKREGEKNLEFIPVYEQKIVVLLPRNHRLAKRKSIALLDMKEEPFILHIQESGMRTVVDQLFEKAGFSPVISCEVEEDHTMAGLVEAKLGVALVSESPQIMNADITILPLESPEMRRYLYLTTVKNRALNPAAQRFKSYILQHLRVG